MRFTTVLAVAAALLIEGAFAAPAPAALPEAVNIEGEDKRQICSCTGFSCYDTCGQKFCC